MECDMTINVGDVVECLNGDNTNLREGDKYTIGDCRKISSGLPMTLLTPYVCVEGRWYHGARFCAPGESRTGLRKQIAALKEELLKANLREHPLVAELRKDLDAVSARRDKFKAQAEEYQLRISDLDKINEALAAEAGVRTAGITAGGVVVLTKAGK